MTSLTFLHVNWHKQLFINPPSSRFQLFLLLVGVAAYAAARPSDIVDFETDNMEVEQEVSYS